MTFTGSKSYIFDIDGIVVVFFNFRLFLLIFGNVILFTTKFMSINVNEK